jgi:hypothetical protein
MDISLLNFSDTYQVQSFITPWSFIHMLTGILIYFYIKIIIPNISVLNAFLIMIVLHTLYEIKDLFYYLNFVKNPSDWNDSSLLNSCGDTIFAIIGFYFASFLKKINYKQLISFTIIYLMFFIYFIINKLG